MPRRRRPCLSRPPRQYQRFKTLTVDAIATDTMNATDGVYASQFKAMAITNIVIAIRRDQICMIRMREIPPTKHAIEITPDATENACTTSIVISDQLSARRDLWGSEEGQVTKYLSRLVDYYSTSCYLCQCAHGYPNTRQQRQDVIYLLLYKSMLGGLNRRYYHRKG